MSAIPADAPHILHRRFVQYMADFWKSAGDIVVQDRDGFPYLDGEWPRTAGLSLELLAAPTVGITAKYDRIVFRFVNAQATYEVMGFDRGALLLRKVDA